MTRLVRYPVAANSFLDVIDHATSREAGIWVVGRGLLRCLLVDEPLFREPIDGSTLGTDVTQGVPCPNQFWVVVIDQVFESPERTSPAQGLGQMSAGRPVADALGKVGHVLEPNVGGKWIDDREIQLVDLDWVSPSMPVSLLQNARCPVRGSINHPCS